MRASVVSKVYLDSQGWPDDALSGSLQAHKFTLKVLTFVKAFLGPLHLILSPLSFNRFTHIHTIAEGAPQATNFS